MNLNSNYLSQESTNADILSIWEIIKRTSLFLNLRVIPKSEYTQSGGGAQRAESNANAFSKNMDVITQSSMLKHLFFVGLRKSVSIKKIRPMGLM
jgi:hypothetical protein